MSTLLYRLGKAVHGRPWYVIGAWVLVFAVIVGVLLASPPKLSSEIRIDGTPAQSVIDDLATKLPEASGGQGLIAFEASDGSRIDQGANEQALLKAVDQIYGADHVIDAREVMAQEVAKGSDSKLLAAAGAVAQAQATQPVEKNAPTPLLTQGQPVPGVVVSHDGKVALFQFQFDKQTFDLPTGAVQDTVDVAKKAVTGYDIEVLPSQTMIQLPELIGVGEIVGVVIAALVLILTLGSLVAAGLPLITALLGVAVGVGGAFTLTEVIQIHALAAVLALMLGLAVGIDYALFIVNRQRRLILDQHLSAREATGRALGTAGGAVLFAGATVIIALLALSVVQIQLLTTMAVVAAVTVALAVLCALTLLPALLGVVNERICSAKARLSAQAAHESGTPHRVAGAWSGWLTRYPWFGAIAAIVVAGVIAIPAFSLSLGLPSGASYNTSTPQRQSYDAVAQGFGDGYNGPLVIVASDPHGDTIDPQNLVGLYRDLSQIDGVETVSLGGTNQAGSTAVFSVIPTTGPTDAKTADVVTAIRQHAADFSVADHVTVGVTGFAALAIDVSARLASVLPIYVAVVIGLSLIVLLLVFRSIIVPLKATVGFLLSVFATFGATTAMFQWGWLQQLLGMDATAPVLSLLPIIVVGVLYGLAMDYEVFLVSSMKEAYVHGHHGRESVVRGFTLASRVVVAAAIIMTSVFAGFAFNSDPMIKQVGFALAFGVLIDAFVVRITLVPAVMAIFGDKAWWLPRWLDRILPDLDIEGDKLVKHLNAVQGTTPVEE
ncbi:MMPL family transporter [soil metagenome]